MLKRVVLVAVVVGVGLVGIGTATRHGSQSRAKGDFAVSGSRSGTSGSSSRVQGQAAPAGFPSETLWSSSNDWEPSVATDPGSSYVYEMTTRYTNKFCGKSVAHCMAFRSSSDGGTTWSVDKTVCPCTASQNDPVMKVASDGTIDQVHMNGWSVVFQKSSDHGQTWSAPVDFKALLGASFTDKPWIAISPTGKDVYVAFNSTNSYVSASHDYGATFSAPLKTNRDALYWFAEGGAIAPNGNVYFSESAEQNSKTPTGPIKLAVVSSTNAGTSWTTTFVDTSQQQPPCNVHSCPADFFGAQATLAVDAGGTAMVVYAKSTAAAGPMSMLERTSSDGVNWSAPVSLGSGATSVGADFPAISAGPTAGDFRVGWMDDRNGASAFNVWYTSTTNSGAAWSSPVRLSNLGSGAPYKTSSGFAFTYGDYFSIAANSSGKSYVIWGEGPNYVGPGGTWSTSGS
jgi:hypothetical protein